MAMPVAVCGPLIMDSLPVARSGSIDSGIAAAGIAMQVWGSVPFLVLGGFLAFPFRKGVWRCKSCGDMPDLPSAIHPK